ncbi:hypothetical protein WMY93_001872 [Mugilogobius chulae]|uniref:Uncharacterized protein n=1 Tax=Mugilogobius chulae TaxID=88201 RepID=A0AAW0PS19_9GOBI
METRGRGENPTPDCDRSLVRKFLCYFSELSGMERKKREKTRRFANELTVEAGKPLKMEGLEKLDVVGDISPALEATEDFIHCVDGINMSQERNRSASRPAKQLQKCPTPPWGS